VEISDVVVRLLAASVVHSVHLNNWSYREGTFINAPPLAYLMEQCPSLKLLSLLGLEMDEDHCRLLGDHSRPGLEIVLNHCRFTSAGAITLAEILGRNQGPTKLDHCFVDNLVLADGLRGKSSLKSLKLRISSNLEVGHREVLAIADALKENKGLVDLDIIQNYFRLSDETWGAICTSLETHSTLEVLHLPATFAAGTTVPAVITSRVQGLLDMLKVNTSIHTIYLDSRYREHAIFRELVNPYLKTNRFRPRLLAIQKIHQIPYRAKVLGRALISARTNPNRFWMLLSGNADVAFPSTTTPAANLSTLVTAAVTATATSTENDADVAAAVMSALMTNAAGRFSTATAAATIATSLVPNITSPSAGQKRKAHP
jgi:hypothetical protein